MRLLTLKIRLSVVSVTSSNWELAQAVTRWRLRSASSSSALPPHPTNSAFPLVISSPSGIAGVDIYHGRHQTETRSWVSDHKDLTLPYCVVLPQWASVWRGLAVHEAVNPTNAVTKTCPIVSVVRRRWNSWPYNPSRPLKTYHWRNLGIQRS